MGTSMYAVVGTWTLAEGRWEEQVRGLHEQIVPLVRQSPGFVAGYWLGDRATGKTSSTVILEDEEAARRFRASRRPRPRAARAYRGQIRCHFRRPAAERLMPHQQGR